MRLVARIEILAATGSPHEDTDDRCVDVLIDDEGVAWVKETGDHDSRRTERLEVAFGKPTVLVTGWAKR